MYFLCISEQNFHFIAFLLQLIFHFLPFSFFVLQQRWESHSKHRLDRCERRALLDYIKR